MVYIWVTTKHKVMKTRKNKYTKEQCDLMVEAAILDVQKRKLMNKVDPNKYCDNCKYTPCACHLISTK